MVPPGGALSCRGGAARSFASGRDRRADRSWCCCTGGRRQPRSIGRRVSSRWRRTSASSPSTTGGTGAGLRARAPFRLEDCADDVAALLGELGIERCIAVGYSMGGPIAQLLWRRHPNLVDGLVLSATSATFNGTARERMLSGMATGGRIIAGAVPMRPITLAALTMCRGWRNLRGSAWWGFEEIARHDWAQIIEAGREICRFDSRSWVAETSVPTTVIATQRRRRRPAPTANSLSPGRSPARRCASSTAATPPARWRRSASSPPSSTPAPRSPTAPRSAGVPTPVSDAA